MTTTRTNLCPNPSSRLSTTRYSFSAGTGGIAALARVTGVGPPPSLVGDVSTSARLTWSTAPTGGNRRIALPRLAVTPGFMFEAEVAIRRLKAGGTILSVDWNGPDSWISTSVLNSTKQSAAMAWTQLSGSAVAPAGAVWANPFVVYADATGPAAGDWIEVLGVIYGDQWPYFDGDTPDAGGVKRWWTGTPNESPSIEARMLTATPDVSAGSVELEIATDPADYPREIVNRTAGSIYAEWERYGPAWSFGGTTDSVTRIGDLVAAYSPNSTALTLELTALVVGRRTVVTLGAQRTSTATQFGIMFGPTGAIPAGAGVWDHVLEFTPTATTETLYINRYANSNPMIRSLSVIDYPPDYDEARFALTRTDANGVRSVRLMAGQQIIAGTLLVTDHEAALTGPVTYRLTTPTGATATAVVTLDGAPAMLAPAIFPQYAVPDVFVTGYEAGRASATVVHEIIGRPDPVTRYAPFKARRGRLVYLCMSYAELVALLDVYRRGEVVLLRQPVHAGLDLYHVATGVREVPADDVFRRWALEVEFVEVAWPRAPLAGAAGWTWDDVVEQFATWDDVAAYFATWNELQIGRTT